MSDHISSVMKDLYEKIQAVNSEGFQLWKEDILFSWRWWLGLGFIIVPWILWIVFRKKASTSRLLHAGFVVLILSSWLDFIGSRLGLWYYTISVVPTIPSYDIWDFTLFPVFTMTLLQWRPQLNTYIKAALFAGISAFAGEPLFVWLKFYDPRDWKSIYSFPILFIIYLIAHYMSRRKSFEDL